MASIASDFFMLTDVQKSIYESAHEFASKEIAPKAKELDETGRFPTEIVEQLGKMGFMGMVVPEEFGGAGLDYMSYAIAIEEISKGCASTGVIMSVNNSLACFPIYQFGSEEQKVKFLKPLAQGLKLGCFGLSEPGNGSDAAGMRTSIKREGDYYVLNGTKNFITNGREADLCVVFASHDFAGGNKSVSAIIVEKGTPGYSVGKLEDKLGITASSTAQLHFDNVKVPAGNLIGTEGLGFKIAMSTLDGGRIGIAAQALGIASAALDAAKKFVKERQAFGKPVAQFQGIQFTVADMASRLDAARLLTWRAAKKKDAGERCTREAAMAKLVASEACMWITTKAIQLHGGYGYVKEYPVERHFRDAKITEIYEGTSEIQRLVIGAAELS